MNPLRNVGGVCSASRLMSASYRLQLWGTAIFCVLLATVLTNAAEEPTLLKEIAWSKGHGSAKLGADYKIVSTSVAFSPDGKRAATAAWGAGKGTVKVWEIPTLKEWLY